MSGDPFHDLFERAAPPAATRAQTRRALDAARPAFVRARRRHRIRVAAATATVCVALAGGAAALLTLDDDEPVDPRDAPTTTVDDRDGPEDAPVDDRDRPEDAPVDDRDGPEDAPVDASVDEVPAVRNDDPLVDPTPTAPPVSVDDDVPDRDTDGEADEPEDGPDDADDDPAEEPDDADDDQAEEPDDADDDPAEEPDDADDDPESPTTLPGEPIIESTAGGSVTVTFDGSTITILSVDANPGFTPEVAEADPTNVEVHFQDGSVRYEIEIRVEGVELRVDSDGPEEL